MSFIFKKSRLIAGIISASMLFSSVPTATLLANNDENDDVDVIGTSSFEVVADEDLEPSESEETVIDENVTSIPSDETEPTEVVVEPSEEPPIETSEVTEPTEETTVEETTTETTTIVETTSETTVEPSEETTETSVEPTETSEPEAPSTFDLVKCVTMDQFVDMLKDLSDSRRVIVETEDEIEVENASALYFEGVYVISFADETSYNDAIAYFEANGITYAVDGSMTVNGNVSYNAFKAKNANGKKVAIIDTGSNNANEYYSVIGDNTSDDNGHGTAMSNIVAESGAYIISIKALGSNGKGQVSDVYVALQLAKDLGVDYVLLSMSLRDLGNYDAFKSIVSDIIANGTTVVASAGNNNRDASLYIPANISGVVTVGALNEDITKNEYSNYGSSVNYWVVADSTSEAAAKYLVLEGTDAVYTEYKEVADISDPISSDDGEYTEGEIVDINGDLYVAHCDEGIWWFADYDNSFNVTRVNNPVVQQGYNLGATSYDLRQAYNNGYTEGWDQGTGTLTKIDGKAGAGNVSINTGNGNVKLISFLSNFDIECEAHTQTSTTHPSAGAKAIPAGDIEYKAHYTISKSGNTYTINWDKIYVIDDGESFDGPNWETTGSKTNVYGGFNRYHALTEEAWNAMGFNSIRSFPGQNYYYYRIDYHDYDGSWHTGTNGFLVNGSGNYSAAWYSNRILEAIQGSLDDYSGVRITSVSNLSRGSWDDKQHGPNGGWNAVRSYQELSYTINYKIASMRQRYYQYANAYRVYPLEASMFGLHLTNKSGNVSGVRYELYDSYGTGDTPSGNGHYIGPITTGPDGKAAFTGMFQPGWYYCALQSGGAIWVRIKDNGDGTVTKYLYRNDTARSYSGSYLVRSGADFDMTVEDWKPTTFDDAIHVVDTATGDKHTVTLAGNSVTNRHFCIEPDKAYTSAISAWLNYYSTASGSAGATYDNLSGILSATALSRVSGSTQTEKVMNLCKILYAWNGVSGRIGTVNTTYSTEQIQRYLWYLLGRSGYTSTYNLAPPKYTPIKDYKGNATGIFNNITYDGTKINNNATINVTDLDAILLKTNNTNFNDTNYSVTVSGSNKVHASIVGNNIYITFDEGISATDINSAKITIKNIVDITNTGAVATTDSYYAFSVSNTSAQQKRFTGYYYEVKPYYNASFSLDFNAEQHIKLRKTSANANMSNTGNCYSLEGTRYSFYYTFADATARSNAFYLIWIDKNGNSVDIDGLSKELLLNQTSNFGRNYYIRESIAGPGYLLDENIYRVTVNASPNVAPVVTKLSPSGSELGNVSVTKSGDTYIINVQDTPTDDPLNITFRKVDENGQIVNTNPYQGARFYIEYYDEDIALTTPIGNRTPKTKLSFTVNASSININLQFIKNNCTAVSTTNIFSSLNGTDLPLGTYRIYEYSAPTGYEVSNQVLRYRIYQPSNGAEAETERRIEGTSSTRNDWTLSGDSATLREAPVIGYFRLNKSMEDQNILESPVSKFNYELYNKDTGDLIATGVITETINGTPNPNGTILWQYKQHIKDINTFDDLYNTWTSRIQLAVYNANGSKINYEVREIIPAGSLNYANHDNIQYKYTTPTGWTRVSDTLFTLTVQMNENSTTSAPYTVNMVNNVEYSGFAISKSIPDQDAFDKRTVKWNVYEVNSNTRIATGTTDANGNVTFTRTDTTGLGITTGADSHATSLNGINFLPYGTYRIEEYWDKHYLNTLDSDTLERIEILDQNLSAGWTRREDATKVYYSFDITLYRDGRVEPAGDITGKTEVVNEEISGWFKLQKQTQDVGDNAPVYFEIYYINPDNGSKLLVAKATATTTNAAGTFTAVFTDYNGTKRANNTEILLPKGQYEIREIEPKTYYVRRDGSMSEFAYTYVIPKSGNTNWNIAWKDSAHTEVNYFYRNVNIENEEVTVLTATATNARVEAQLSIYKEYTASVELVPEVDFEFEIYYRGNGTAAQNVGNFDAKYLVEKVTVNCTDGSGVSDPVTRLPEGWYEIREVNATNWTIGWRGKGEVTGNNTKVVNVTSNGRTVRHPQFDDRINNFGFYIKDAVVANNTVSVQIEITKLDRWTHAVVRTASLHPENIHLTFALYNDGNNNEILDADEMEQYIASEDANEDGIVVFKNVSFGHYIIRETKTINGYYLTAVDIPVAVLTPDNIVFGEATPDTTPRNQPYTVPVEITKLDGETNEPLSGAEFEIYVDVNENGKYDAGTDVRATAWVDENNDGLVDQNEITTCVITEDPAKKGTYRSNGQLHFNDGYPEFGNQYILREVNAPANYFFVDPDTGDYTGENTEIVFVVDAADTTAANFKVVPVEKTIKNVTGTVTVYKKTEDGSFLSGCVFKVYTDEACTNEFATLIEDATNKCYYYKGLGLNTYYLKEVSVPDNYETDPTAYEFRVTTDNIHPVVDNLEWRVLNQYNTTDTNVFVNLDTVIKTTLVDDQTKDHIATVADTIKLVDTIEYKGLHVGEEYEVTGYLYDTKTGEKYTDAEGNEVTATRTFTPETSMGSVDLEFTFTYKYDVVTVVAYEYVYREGKLVGTHADLNDKFQQVKFPSIHTTLLDEITNEHVGQQREEITLVDTVTYENLLLGYTYKMVGKLMNSDTQTPLLDDEGNEIIATTEFTPEEENGTVDVVFTFKVPATLLAGTTTVAFESLLFTNTEVTDVTICTHNDFTDLNQTVDVPNLKTTFYDIMLDGDEDHGIARNGENVTLVDKVEYDHITVGLTYTVFGTVMVKETGEPLRDAEGNVITASTTFTPETSSGYVNVVFENIDTTQLADKTLVAFETLEFKGINIVIHADLDDNNQTVHIPEIHTTALSEETNEHVAPVTGTTTIVDTVAYSNLVVGKEYMVTGTMVNQETGETLLDADGDPVTGFTVFTAETEDGTVDVLFEVDSSVLAGTTYVVFEDLYRNTVKIEVHADIEDESQTIDFPNIKTTFYCVDFTDINEDSENIGRVDDKVTLADKVKYDHLTPSLEYTVSGVVMDKATGEPILINGEQVVSSTTFVPTEESGIAIVIFEDIDTSALRGKTLVAFETLSIGDVELVIHADIDDNAQTVKFPDLQTTLVGEDNVVRVDEEVTLVDTVHYSNLVVGKEYTVDGILMDKATEKPLKDANGEVVTGTTTFIAEAEEGDVEVIFTFNSSLLRGQTTVAFETLKFQNIEVVVHADINDEGQTVVFPDVKTFLIDTATQDKMVKLGEKITLTDTVSYENLTPGKTYTLEGGLRITDMTYLDGDVDYKTTKTFVPAEPNGTVDMIFEIDSTALIGKTIVAFETISYNSKIVVAHTDMFDLDQTVYVADIHTTAADKVDGDNIIDGTSTDQTVVDTVYYENLVPGKTYTVTGKLVVKKDGEVEYATDVLGNIIEASTEFTPTTPNGTVEVVFEHINAAKYAGKKLVAFETVSYEGVELATHADIEDKEQTITVSLVLHIQIAKADKDNVAYFLKDAEITIFYAELDEDGELIKDEDGNVIYKVAKDVNGADCVGMTDENGNVDFSVVLDRDDIKYFAKETKAPEGYNICDDYFEVVPDESREDLGTCLININILDAIIIIPPKTGDNMNLALISVLAALSVIGIIGCVVFLKKKATPLANTEIEPMVESTDASDETSD